MKWFDIDKEMRCHCGCEMPAEVRENEKALIETVLDDARERYGKPIVVNSGYRCEKYNRDVVHGAANSQHCGRLGNAAADIRTGVSGLGDEAFKAENLKIARAIVAGGNWDQMILYVDNAKSLAPRFVHVSWKRGGANRREVRKKVIGGAPIYPKLNAAEMAVLTRKEGVKPVNS